MSTKKGGSGDAPTSERGRLVKGSNCDTDKAEPADTWLDRIGEKVLPQGPNAPDNKWNSAAHPWRGGILAVMQILVILYEIFLMCAAFAEFSTDNNDHYWSITTWWDISLAGFCATGCLLLLTACLQHAKKPVGDEKKNQQYPPPLQSWHGPACAFVFDGLAFFYILNLNNQSAPSDIGYTRQFLLSMLFIVIGSFSSFCVFLMAFQCTMRPTMPQDIDEAK